MCKITNDFKRQVALTVLRNGVLSLMEREGVNEVLCSVDWFKPVNMPQSMLSNALLHRICKFVYGFGAVPMFSYRYGTAYVSFKLED